MIVPLHKTGQPTPTLIGHNCKDSFLPNSNQLMEHLVAGIIDQNKSYKDAGIDLARVQKHHRPPAAAEELQQNPLQPAAWNYRVIMGPIQAGLDPACHTEPRSLISFFPTREPRSAASRPCLLQFSPPRPRINSEPSNLQEDFKPPLEVNLCLSQPFRRLERIRKLREGQERLDLPVPPALPPLIRRRLRPNCGPGR